MKPLVPEAQDIEALQELGRASVQIVHDLKNQIGGFKLYATFLRRRLEKSERPDDEIETLGKLIAGLERAAFDLSLLVRFGRPVELSLQSHIDLAELLKSVFRPFGEILHSEHGSYRGAYDVTALTEALGYINEEAASMSDATPQRQPTALELHLRREIAGPATVAVIEWQSAGHSTGHAAGANGTDPFRSFANARAFRLALAAKIIQAHGGQVEHGAGILRARLPLQNEKPRAREVSE